MSYSSPFSKKFCGKNPIQKKLVGKQNRLPDHLKKAIEAAPEMKGSPNHKHGEKFRDQARELSKGNVFRQYIEVATMKAKWHSIFFV